jgi:hypothetical protein
MAENPYLFESAWLKWSWAVAHAYELESRIVTWRDHPDRKRGVDLRKQYDAKRHRIDVTVNSVEPLPLEWGLVLGDVAHNYRSCLDHIAWALVQRGRTPPDRLTRWQRGKVCFPIVDGERTDFNSALPRCLPGVRRADIAVVRSHQPYKHGKRVRSQNALAILARISNDDKHRTVQPILTMPRDCHYKVSNQRDCVITETKMSGVFRAGPLEVGAKLAPVYIRKTGPHPDVEMEGQLAAMPTIEGVFFLDWLTKTRDIIAFALRSLSDPPTELIAKLGPG